MILKEDRSSKIETPKLDCASSYDTYKVSYNSSAALKNQTCEKS